MLEALGHCMLLNGNLEWIPRCVDFCCNLLLYMYLWKVCTDYHCFLLPRFQTTPLSSFFSGLLFPLISHRFRVSILILPRRTAVGIAFELPRHRLVKLQTIQLQLSRSRLSSLQKPLPLPSTICRNSPKPAFCSELWKCIHRSI